MNELKEIVAKSVEDLREAAVEAARTEVRTILQGIQKQNVAIRECLKTKKSLREKLRAVQIEPVEYDVDTLLAE